MLSVIIKIWQHKWMLRNILQTIYFNFHYLSFKQAIKLPIILYKPHFIKLKGNIVICPPGKLKFAMIILGKTTSPLHSNNGFSFMNEGKIKFGGNCKIGNDCSIVVSKNAYLELGDGFQATAGLKLNCSYNIKFGKDVLVGFDCYFMDTDFHHLTMIDGSDFPQPYGMVNIGDGCWFAFRDVVMKNTVVPERCVIASNSLLNKIYNCPPCSLLAGSPALLRKTGLYLNRKDHVINYQNDDK